MTDVDTSKDSSARTPVVSRRQLVKAGAWAAPVVLLTTAAPAAAALTTPPAPNGSLEVTEVTIGGTGPWTVSVKVKNNATNAADAAVGSVTVTATNGTWAAGNTSATFSLAPGAETTITSFPTISRDITKTGAVLVAATPSAPGYNPVAKEVQVAPALGTLTLTINTPGSNNFTVTATNPAGNPSVVVDLVLSSSASGGSASMSWAGTTSGSGWAWDNALRRVRFTLAGGASATTLAVGTATGLTGGSGNKIVTLNSGTPSFQGQVFPATAPASKSYTA